MDSEGAEEPKLWSNQIRETEYEKHKSLKIEGWLEGVLSDMTFADMQ